MPLPASITRPLLLMRVLPAYLLPTSEDVDPALTNSGKLDAMIAQVCWLFAAYSFYLYTCTSVVLDC
jgi:hypothetical protein